MSESFWITLIANAAAILLAAGGFLQVVLAALKKAKNDLAGKLDDNTNKTEKIHLIVNGQRDAMQAKLDALAEKVNALEVEKARSEAQVPPKG